MNSIIDIKKIIGQVSNIQICRTQNKKTFTEDLVSLTLFSILGLS